MTAPDVPMIRSSSERTNSVRSPTARSEALPSWNGLISAAASPTLYPMTPLNPEDGYPDYLKLILTARVYDIAKETPLTPAEGLSLRLGQRIYLKREDLQPAFSFKCRGSYNKMFNLTDEEKKSGVIACSAGNHAQGVALAAKKLGLKSTIVMPVLTPEIKIRAVQRLGANVILHGADFDAAKTEALRLKQQHKLTFIHPFDDPLIIAGQGTIGVELLRQLHVDDIDTIFCCVGGGGMIAGIAAYVKRIAPKIRIVGVEAVDAAGMTRSIEKGYPVELEEVGLFADGAAIRMPGKEPFRICAELVDEMILVNNDEICAAIKDIFEGIIIIYYSINNKTKIDTRAVVEPAGALSVAGMKKWLNTRGSATPEHTPPKVISTSPKSKTVQGKVKDQRKAFIAILSGANMNFDRLRFVAERAELGEKREALISIIIPEEPGSFLKMYQIIHPRQIRELTYRYADPANARIFCTFTVPPLERHQDVSNVLRGFRQAGMLARDLSDNEMAKTHARFLIGGRSAVENERVLSFMFPERPGVMKKFLELLNNRWNMTLFHYRNVGSGKK